MVENIYSNRHFLIRINEPFVIESSRPCSIFGLNFPTVHLVTLDVYILVKSGQCAPSGGQIGGFEAHLQILFILNLENYNNRVDCGSHPRHHRHCPCGQIRSKGKLIRMKAMLQSIIIICAFGLHFELKIFKKYHFSKIFELESRVLNVLRQSSINIVISLTMGGFNPFVHIRDFRYNKIIFNRYSPS